MNAPHWPCPNNCLTWCRAVHLDRLTNHNPHCEYVDESLIDVWKLTIDGTSCYFDDAPLTEEMGLEPNEFTLTKSQMHREIYEHLPEFLGF